MKKNLIDYRTKGFIIAAVCTECEFLNAVTFSLVKEYLINCKSCGSTDMMLQLSPRIVQLKRWRQQHLQKINDDAFDDRLLAIVSRA